MDFLKDIGNGIYLKESEEKILNRYEIDYKNCSNINDLIFKIEEYLNEQENEELEQISLRLSEFNYYHNTNK